MYIANRRDSSKFKGCRPLQIYLGLIGLKSAIAYLPYTHRCRALKTTIPDKNSQHELYFHRYEYILAFSGFSEHRLE